MELIIKKHSRIDLLDAVRGIAILAMVFYHALFDLQDVFQINTHIFSMLEIFEPPFAGAFILLAGVSCRFSHNNYLRGLKVLALAMAVTVVTVLLIPGQSIYFGILHFMGVSILIYALFGRWIEKIPVRAGLVLWGLLFVLTCLLPLTGSIGIPGLWMLVIPGSFYSIPGSFLFGLPGPDFYSADYFPLIPWIFLFLAGAAAGLPIRQNKLPEKFYTMKVPFLAAVGRNTLLIYALHQPVIYGLLFLFVKGTK
ncbi:MAG TPA: heparan-alpha-glucosaminide N-acetyltransferase [Clostridia bacterium]|nr:heparan-alpha-glucosaminide N-acetyltransferase [Clostridia bacterium]